MHGRSRSRRRPRGDGTRGPRTSSCTSQPVSSSSSTTAASHSFGSPVVGLGYGTITLLAWLLLTVRSTLSFVLLPARLLGSFFLRAVTIVRRPPFISIFILFLLGGFCLEANVVAGVAEPEVLEPAELEYVGQLTQELCSLEQTALVTKAKLLEGKCDSSLNGWGISVTLDSAFVEQRTRQQFITHCSEKPGRPKSGGSPTQPKPAQSASPNHLTGRRRASGALMPPASPTAGYERATRRESCVIS